MLVQGHDLGSIYRTHVKVGLWKECQTLEDGIWDCYDAPSSMMVLLVFLFLDAVLAVAGCGLASFQHFTAWRDAKNREKQKNVPGVLFWEFLAACLAFFSGILAVVILLVVKGLFDGAASMAFFLCAIGAFFLFWGSYLAFCVAFMPVGKPAWSVKSVPALDDNNNVNKGWESYV